jgi:HD-GYP domain-containing protein (c-di-GMP phosphodiesterase class II)
MTGLPATLQEQTTTESNWSPQSAEPRTTIARIDELSVRLQRLDARRTVQRPHPGLLLVRDEQASAVLSTVALWHSQPEWFSGLRQAAGRASAVVLFGTLQPQQVTEARTRGLVSLLRSDATDVELGLAIDTAIDWVKLNQGHSHRSESLTRYEFEFGELSEIARALTTERRIDRLLGVILEKSRLVTGADAGSLYVVETDANVEGGRRLHFKLSQNDSVRFDWSEFTMPVDRCSMAGWVALECQTVRIDDVYQPQTTTSFGFDRSFDERTGYRTKSMICTPLVTSRGEVIGVLQLINKKRLPTALLTSPEDIERSVVPFDTRSEQLLLAVAAQAGIALENALLYDEILGLFDGLVRESVDAIESRDPTTSGHSRRVAALTTELARAVEACRTGIYADVHWLPEELRELEYASLLHDFGKIGVKESVLVKAKKLQDSEIESIRQRFDFIIRSLQFETVVQKSAAIQQGSGAEAMAHLESELARSIAAVEDAYAIIEHANEPTVLAEGDFSRLAAFGALNYRAIDGQLRPWLLPNEIASLSVKRGSLTAHEFDEIRGHVSHTFRFLSRIPWGRTFARVPLIAGAHHERLDGTGYPNHLTAEQIPLQSKMMSIADIFDALTASDRPYKRAVPIDRALDIIGLEVKDGHLDRDLVQLFIDAKPWSSVTIASSSQ